MAHDFFINGLAAFAGWLAWNALLLSIDKDENEEKFTLRTYFSEHWDNWVASLFMIPILLFIGYKGLQINIGFEEGLEWSDLYYVCSGFAVEVIKVAYKKWKAK